MTDPGEQPLSLRRVELAAGLVLMTVGVLVVRDGVVGIVNSRCGSLYPAGVASTGCWSTLPGYFVVMGVILYAVGLVFSVLGGLRRSKITPISPGDPQPTRR